MGRHRRVRLSDLLEYQQETSNRRRAALDELTAEASEAGLHDEEVDYSEALRLARGKKS